MGTPFLYESPFSPICKIAFSMKIEGRAQMTFGIYDLDQMVPTDHPLRRIKKIIDFGRLAHLIKDCASDRG